MLSKSWGYLLLIIAFSHTMYPSSKLPAEDFQWFSKSGIWKNQTLESGNKVLKQTFQFDRQKNKAPVPYLMFRTIKLTHENRNHLITNISKIKFLLNVDSIYSKNGKGEAAIFLNGENEKSLYFVQFLYNKKWFYKVSLFKSSIINPKLSLRRAGNYKLEELAYTKINFPVICRKEIFIKLKNNGIRVFLNDRLVLSYFRTPKTPWINFTQSFFAIGSRSANIWIDNVVLHEFKNNWERIIYQDDFSVLKIKRFVIKKLKQKKQ